MPAFNKFVNIKQTAKDRNNWRMVIEEWVGRSEAMMRATTYILAKETYEQVLGRIPGVDGYRELKDSLRVSRILAGTPAYSVHVPSKGRRVKKIDVATTVIYVRVKKRLRKNRKDLMFLENNGPWTTDTIPFWPSYKVAAITQRKVTKRQADAVADRQKKVASRVKRELAAMGKKDARQSDQKDGAVKRNTKKAIPDLAMQGLNLEFGMSGQRSRPVFRPAINAVKGRAKSLAARYKIVVEAMTDPNTQRWKTFPPEKYKITSKQASEFDGFIKRLGY